MRRTLAGFWKTNSLRGRRSDERRHYVCHPMSPKLKWCHNSGSDHRRDKAVTQGRTDPGNRVCSTGGREPPAYSGGTWTTGQADGRSQRPCVGRPAARSDRARVLRRPSACLRSAAANSPNRCSPICLRGCASGVSPGSKSGGRPRTLLEHPHLQGRLTDADINLSATRGRHQARAGPLRGPITARRQRCSFLSIRRCRRYPSRPVDQCAGCRTAVLRIELSSGINEPSCRWAKITAMISHSNNEGRWTWLKP